MIKVCHINYYADRGGAGIAALRLHHALQRYSAINSAYLVVDDCGISDKSVITLCKIWQQKMLHIQQSLLWNIYRLQKSQNYTGHTFNLFSGHLVGKIRAQKPDVIHLHSIVGEMCSIADIARLSREFPLVWTLHDCWPFTGTEQYPLADGRRFIDGYMACNKEDDGWDMDRFFWQKKARLWKNCNITFIAPSRWIQSQIQRSALWQACDCEVIGNCIDTGRFAHRDKRLARRKLGIPEDGFFLGIGASSLQNVNKGGADLEKVLALLKNETINLLSIGSGQVSSDLKCFPLGYISDEQRKIDFYNACDLFLSTSKYDNLPNMIMEAMACGTPVAAFANGGIPDLVTEENGIPVASNSVEQLADKIITFLRRPERNPSCSEYIQERYSMPVIAEKHEQLYKRMIMNASGK